MTPAYTAWPVAMGFLFTETKRLVDNPPVLSDGTPLVVYRPRTPTPPVPLRCRTVEVLGLEPSLQEYLQRYFQKKQKSGGGPIEAMATDQKYSCATITFCNQEGTVGM